MTKTKSSPKSKKLLIIGISVGVVLIGITFYGIWSIYSFFSQFGSPREVPDAIKQTRVLKGEGFLAKSEIFKLTKESFFETIGDASGAETEEEREKITQSKIAKGIYNFSDLEVFDDKIIAVGEFGGYVFDLKGNLQNEILFEPTKEKIKIGWYEQDTYRSNLDNLEIVELEKGKFGFVSLGSVSGVSIFDSKGKRLWEYGKDDVDLSNLLDDEKEKEKRYEESTHVLEATVGDLNNDGIGEFIVARKNIGIEVFDQKGNKQFTIKDEFPSEKLTVADLDNDGQAELIQIGSKIFDNKGKLIRETKGSASDAVLIVENEEGQKTFQFCNAYENKITCEDENGKEFFKGDAPLSEVPTESDSESVYEPQAVWVGFKKDEPKYLAVIASYIGLP